MSETGEVVDGSKRSSVAVATSRTPKLAKEANIDDISDDLLAEILSRLPCCKFITRCKCVSKRWGTLISKQSFIVRFLCHQSVQKQTHTLINREGEEFFTKMSLSPKPLDHLFKKLNSYHHLKQEPYVVATINDLVLCCAPPSYQCYCICNPFTNQWVTLPPPPPLPPRFRPDMVGFICDLPYYEYCKKGNQGEHVIQLNAEYNCKVVRLVPPSYYEVRPLLNEFKVQIFSSDTGEWIELIVSSPFKFRFHDIDSKSVACNEMLYWSGDHFLIGLDAFMIKKSNSSTGLCTSSSSSTSELDDSTTEHNYGCHFIEIEKSDDYDLMCLGVNGGCLKLGFYNPITTLYLCDLNVDQMARFHGEGGVGKLSRNMVLDSNMPLLSVLCVINDWDIEEYTFDPSDCDVLYLRTNREIIMCNIRTTEWSEIFPRIRSLKLTNFYPLMIPSWPTPLPRLPHTMAGQSPPPPLQSIHKPMKPSWPSTPPPPPPPPAGSRSLTYLMYLYSRR